MRKTFKTLKFMQIKKKKRKFGGAIRTFKKMDASKF